jgi:hypothetical protein
LTNWRKSDAQARQINLEDDLARSNWCRMLR